MYVQAENYNRITQEVQGKGATLVAVSKTKPAEAIRELYQMGHRDFGENYVQELVEKQQALPEDIRWHFIGHLQTNKVKFIAPFIHLVHGIDSIRLLKEVDKQGKKNHRTIDVLLQVHIAQEETKFGLDENELTELLSPPVLEPLENVRITGLMGMASFSDDEALVRNEFKTLKRLFDQHRGMDVLSMGMSGDYKIALEEGSTLVRIGSLVFGTRGAAEVA